MRSYLLLLLLLLEQGCGPAERPSTDDGADACATETTITGRVYAPNGTLPLHGAFVYIPQRELEPVPDGVSCARCSDPLPGGELVRTASDVDGSFELRNVPAGTNVPVVIQIGRWRRKVVIPFVQACAETQLLPESTRLPRTRAEGDIPRIAIATGNCDALECLLRKLGVDDAELTTADGPGRVHLYSSNGVNQSGGQVADPASELWSDPVKLAQYDAALFSCECNPHPEEKSAAMRANVKAYADSGGRLFLSHYQSLWLSDQWPATATCDRDALAEGSGVVDRAGTGGDEFAAWMEGVGGTEMDRFRIEDGKQTCTAIDPARAEQWVFAETTGYPQIFQFTTPNERPSTERCGKVVFSDMHVAAASTSVPNVPFPMGCSANALTAQEKALAYMLFDLSACVGPVQ